MCFGNEQTGQRVTSSQANPAVQDAATSNLSFAQNLRDQGFQGYGGQQVANFSPQQQASFGMTDAAANNGTGQDARSLINTATTGGPSRVDAPTIQSAMSPYMNEYVMRALAPQLQQADMSWANARKATDATATGSGAFGDARTGIEQANNNFLSNVSREGLIGNAYNNAFNTAIGAGAQDVSNRMAAQGQTGNFMEQYLNRALTGSGALQGLQNQQLGVAGAVNQMGQQQTAQDQARLTAQYNQWLMAQQYPFQTAGLVNQTVGAGSAAMPATQTATTYAPNNSGLSALGSIGGVLTNLAFLSDRRAKTDIDVVGSLLDGTKVYAYRYKGDPRKQIGLMADEVEEKTPDAVLTHPSGLKMVDYARATARSRLLSMAV